MRTSDNPLTPFAGPARPGPGKSSVLYCVVPSDLGATVHDALLAHFRGLASVEVVVERRHSKRRRRNRRSPRRCTPPPGGKDARRARNPDGRRLRPRRHSGAPARCPGLPGAAEPYAERLDFVTRYEPSSLELEDEDTARIVSRSQGGDSAAFDEIYRRYFARVYSYVRAILRNAEAADDVAQNVFIRVFQGLPRYERRGSPFRAWLFQIVRNCAVDQLNQNRPVTLMAPADLADRIEDGDRGAPPSLGGGLWTRDARALIECLPRTQQQVLMLRHLVGMKSHEVARVIGRSPAAIRQLESRALRVLRDRPTPPLPAVAVAV